MAIYFIYNSTVCFAFQPDCYRNVFGLSFRGTRDLGIVYK